MAHCTGYGNCHQGRKPCKTAWACGIKEEASAPSSTESTKGLFTSGWFYIFLLVCLLIWSGLWEAGVAWLRHH